MFEKKTLNLFIIVIFLSGLCLGFWFFETKPEKVQAAKLVYIHHATFRKMVEEYLRTHQVPCKRAPHKLCKISKEMIDRVLMPQLDRDGYFTFFYKKRDRLAYIENTPAHRGVLREHLEDGFEAQTNYEYYTGNKDYAFFDNGEAKPTNIHSFWDVQWYKFITDESLAGQYLQGLIDTAELSGFSVVRNVAFRDAGPSDLVEWCANHDLPQAARCLTAEITGTLSVPELIDKHEIPEEDIGKIYATRIMMTNLVFKDEYFTDEQGGYRGWKVPQETDVLFAVLEFSQKVEEYIKNPPPGATSYEDALQWAKMMEDIPEAFGWYIGGVKPMRGGKLPRKGRFVVGGPRPTTYAFYRVTAGDVNISVPTLKLKVMTSATSPRPAIGSHPARLVDGKASVLRGATLKSTVARTYELLADYEFYYADIHFFTDWQLKINRNLRADVFGTGTLKYATGYCDASWKMMWLDEAVARNRSLGRFATIRQALHATNPNFQNSAMGEAFTNFMGKRLLANWEYGTPLEAELGSDFIGYFFEPFKQKLATLPEVGTAQKAAKMLEDLHKNPIKTPLDLDELLGRSPSFYQTFNPHVERITYLNSETHRLMKVPPASRNTARIAEYVAEKDALLDDLSKMTADWVIHR